MLGLLKTADFGVTQLNVREQRRRMLSRTPAANLFFLFEPNTEKKPAEDDAYLVRKFVVLKHLVEGRDVELDEANESDGTKQYISHLPQLIRTLSEGGLHVIDELDSSLHPLRCRALIAPFTSRSMNPHNAQLLFTTHDATLLSANMLRRDEIWLTEKAMDGASRLFSLADYAPRRDENIEKGYLQGRYRGVPELFSLAMAQESLLGHE